MWCGVKMNESYLALILGLCRAWWLCRARRWNCWWPLHHFGWSGKIHANSYFCWFYVYVYNLDGWVKDVVYALNVYCGVPLHLMVTTHLLSWRFIESALAQIKVHKKKYFYTSFPPIFGIDDYLTGAQKVVVPLKNTPTWRYITSVIEYSFETGGPFNNFYTSFPPLAWLFFLHWFLVDCKRTTFITMVCLT
jgi:hypothetical protein